MATLGSSFWGDVKQFLSMGLPFDEGLQAASANLKDSGAQQKVEQLLGKLQAGSFGPDWLGALEGVIPETILSGLSAQGSKEPLAFVDDLLSAWRGGEAALAPGAESGARGLGGRLLDPLKWLTRNLASERESLLSEVNTWLERDGVEPDIPTRDSSLRDLFERLSQADVLSCEIRSRDDSHELRYGEQREELTPERASQLLAALRAAGRPQPLGPGERWSLSGADGQRAAVVSCAFGDSRRTCLRLLPPEEPYSWAECLARDDERACSAVLSAEAGLVLALAPADKLESLLRGLVEVAAAHGRTAVCVEPVAPATLGKAWPLSWQGALTDPGLSQLLSAQGAEVLGFSLADGLGQASSLALDYADRLLVLAVRSEQEAALRLQLRARLGADGLQQQLRGCVRQGDTLEIEPAS